MSLTPKGTWFYRLRWLLLLGAFVSFRLVQDRYRAYRDRQDRAQTVRQAPAYLEGSNALRHRVGLWPITPDFKGRDYDTDPGESDVYSVSLRRAGWRYPPWPNQKVVAYNPERQQLLWEIEFIYLLSATHRFTSEYSLERSYSYTAKKGENPWTITLHSSYPRADTLSVAQADSVLRHWRVLGQQDSLADVAQGRNY